MKRFNLLVIAFPFTIMLSCREKSKNECDYHSISTALLYNIKSGNKVAIKKMSALNDKEEAWEDKERSINEDLVLVQDIEHLDYRVVYYKESPTSFAVITILLNKKGGIRDFLEVRFFHPNSPFGCKIESFDFIRTGINFKIDIKPPTNDSN